jgi:PIN domain nuclease of toxin-antitoxin system
MRALLDTHTFIWMMGRQSRLSERGRAFLEDPESELVLSVGSVWEIAIKVGTGKLQLPEPADSWVPRRMRETDIAPLPFTLRNALTVGRLPRHHGDPFDRMLIAQALDEEIPVVTADRRFAAYGVETISP